MLVYLAVENGMAHQRGRLSSLLWQEANEQRARQNLSQALYDLQRMFGKQRRPFLLVEGDTLQFNRFSDHWIDIIEFSRLIAGWEAHQHTRLSECPSCLDRLTKAAGLYRGDFLTGFTLRGCPDYDEWIRYQSQRLREMVVSALYHLVAALEERGDLNAALRASWQLVAIDELWEQAQRQLINLLANSGRREAALAQYRVFQRVLHTELGDEPDVETQSIYERLSESTPASRAGSFRQLHNLPAALTGFIDRDQELQELKRLIGDPSIRLITVTGPGGCGKTRLAIEAALSQVNHFRDGAYLVPLGTLEPRRSGPEAFAATLASAISAAIASTLNLSLLKQVSSSDRLINHLRDRQVMLVLDSFEHLVEGADFLADLLKAAPELKILLTSRLKLNIAGEHHLFLTGMGCPKSDDDLEDALESGAVRLFAEAGSRARPGFSVTAENIGSVGRICKLVDGMPLGLLLAAAWLGTFSTGEVAAEIERNLNFLSTDWPDVPERQRSMRATFDYSWGLLSEKEQQILAGLSIFRGGFTRQAAERIVQASPEDLRNLIDKSLLERRQDGRYTMHELLRQYAEGKLAQTPEAAAALHEEFARYYFDLLLKLGAELNGPQSKVSLEQIDKEYSNLAVGRRWAAEHWEGNEFYQALEVMRSYHTLGYRHAEGLSISQDAENHLAKKPQTPQVLHMRGELHTWMADYCRLLGHPAEIETHLELARSYLEQAAAHGIDVRTGLAWFWLIRGQCESVLEAQREAFSHSLALGRELGDVKLAAQVLVHLGAALSRLGQYEDALRCHMESLELFRELEDPAGIAQALTHISYNHISMGEHKLSYQTMVSAAEYYRQVGSIAEAGEALRGLGLVLVWNGRFAEGADLLEQSLPLLRASTNLLGLVFANAVLGIAQMHLCDDTSARAFLNEAMSLAHKWGYWREYATALFGFGCVELAAGNYRQAKIYYEQSVARYRSLQYLGELGWSQGGLSLALRAMGERKQAWRYLEEGLQIIIDSRSLAPMLTCFLAAPLLLIDAGKLEAALEIFSTAKTFPSVGSSPWVEQICGAEVISATAAIDAETTAAIQARAATLDHRTAAARAKAALESVYD